MGTDMKNAFIELEYLKINEPERQVRDIFLLWAKNLTKNVF